MPVGCSPCPQSPLAHLPTADPCWPSDGGPAAHPEAAVFPEVLQSPVAVVGHVVGHVVLATQDLPDAWPKAEVQMPPWAGAGPWGWNVAAS